MALELTPGQSERELLSEKVKRQMNQPLIHESWESTFRNEGNERFFEQAFDYIVALLRQPQDSLALDIGCGIGANSVRLARRGYRVLAADYPESILTPAHENVERRGVADRIDIRREDILNLSFPDAQFDLVLCWGVLMHIPAAERAISQLTRVTRAGGYIVLEECNAHAPEAILMHAYWRLLKEKAIRSVKTPVGVKHQCQFGGETLFWRDSERSWLVDQLGLHSCRLVASGSGLFTDLYQYLPFRLLQSLAHAWNRFWLRRINRPRLAHHNIFVFQKSRPRGNLLRLMPETRAATESLPGRASRAWWSTSLKKSAARSNPAEPERLPGGRSDFYQERGYHHEIHLPRFPRRNRLEQDVRKRTQIFHGAVFCV
jgi:2-polyprenyl-3-methyl-5-hydroxy-6-metoxy-1,4-benzoquinol methylase